MTVKKQIILLSSLCICLITGCIPTNNHQSRFPFQEVPPLQKTKTGWFISFPETPIESFSITNNHAFASMDYGLLHFYPLSLEAKGEILLPVQIERCLNHKVQAGTDKDRYPISQYQYIQKNALYSVDLYCDKEQQSVTAKANKKVSLKNWPQFGAGAKKFHLLLDPSSKTTFLSQYEDLLFISKTGEVKEHRLQNYAIADAMNGSTYYYLAKDPVNNEHFLFHTIHMDAQNDSWSFDPCPQELAVCKGTDAVFQTIAQQNLFFIRFSKDQQRCCLVQPIAKEGKTKNGVILSNPTTGPIPISSIYSYLSNGSLHCLGAFFNKGEIVCYNEETGSVLWQTNTTKLYGLLDIQVDLEKERAYLLLENGSLDQLDLVTGKVLSNRPLVETHDSVLYSTGSLKVIETGVIGYLNNSHKEPFRSIFFFDILDSF